MTQDIFYDMRNYGCERRHNGIRGHHTNRDVAHIVLARCYASVPAISGAFAHISKYVLYLIRT